MWLLYYNFLNTEKISSLITLHLLTLVGENATQGRGVNIPFERYRQPKIIFYQMRWIKNYSCQVHPVDLYTWSVEVWKYINVARFFSLSMVVRSTVSQRRCSVLENGNPSSLWMESGMVLWWLSGKMGWVWILVKIWGMGLVGKCRR